MPREYRTDQPLHQQAPAPRVIEGQVVATRVERRPARRVWTRPALPRPRIGWGQLALRAAGVLAASAAVVGLGWLLVKAVMSLVTGLLVLVALVVAWVQANWLWLVLAAGLLLFLLARFGSRSSCAGLHCGGCRR